MGLFSKSTWTQQDDDDQQDGPKEAPYQCHICNASIWGGWCSRCGKATCSGCQQDGLPGDNIVCDWCA